MLIQAILTLYPVYSQMHIRRRERMNKVRRGTTESRINPEAEETHKKGESGEAGCSRTMEEELMGATNLEASEENERGTQTCVSGCDREDLKRIRN